jgi:protein TonB
MKKITVILVVDIVILLSSCGHSPREFVDPAPPNETIAEWNRIVNKAHQKRIADSIAKVKEDKVEIIDLIESAPVYPGGDSAFIKFIKENIKYPEEARKHGIQGKVFVTLVIESDGSISNVKVLRGIEWWGFNEEAIRIVMLMPKWIPAKQRGIPVRAQCNLPIKFEN